MRKAIVLLFVASLFGLSVSADGTWLEVSNGGFEIRHPSTFAPDTWPADWKALNMGVQGRFCDTDTARTGLCGVRIFATRDSAQTLQQVLANLPNVGDTIELRYWSKWDVDSIGGAQLVITYTDATTAILNLNLPVPSGVNPVWTEFVGTIVVTKPVASVTVNVRTTRRNSRIWFDDASVQYLPPVTP